MYSDKNTVVSWCKKMTINVIVYTCSAATYVIMWFTLDGAKHDDYCKVGNKYRQLRHDTENVVTSVHRSGRKLHLQANTGQRDVKVEQCRFFSPNEAGFSLFFANEETAANDMVCSTLLLKYLLRWEQRVIREGPGQAASVWLLWGLIGQRQNCKNPWWKVDGLTKKLKEEMQMPKILIIVSH